MAESKVDFAARAKAALPCSDFATCRPKRLCAVCYRRPRAEKALREAYAAGVEAMRARAEQYFSSPQRLEKEAAALLADAKETK